MTDLTTDDELIGVTDKKCFDSNTTDLNVERAIENFTQAGRALWQTSCHGGYRLLPQFHADSEQMRDGTWR